MKTYKLTLTITTDNDDLQKDYDDLTLITAIEGELTSDEKIIEHKLEEITTTQNENHTTNTEE